MARGLACDSSPRLSQVMAGRPHLGWQSSMTPTHPLRPGRRRVHRGCRCSADGAHRGGSRACAAGTLHPRHVPAVILLGRRAVVGPGVPPHPDKGLVGSGRPQGPRAHDRPRLQHLRDLWPGQARRVSLNLQPCSGLQLRASRLSKRNRETFHKTGAPKSLDPLDPVPPPYLF